MRRRPAVEICHECGAAVCEHHVVVREHHLTRTMTMLREVPIDPAARTMRCTTCDAADAAKTATTTATGTRRLQAHSRS